MSTRSPYEAVIKARRDKTTKAKKRKGEVSEEMEEWRTYWREAGPIRFAEEVLTCPQDVPAHPDLGKVPKHIILSDDQREFLEDLWKHGIRKFILAAGRGAGKTFIIAVYVTWRVCCFDHWTMTVMGGAMEQSEKIKQYVDEWRDDIKEVFYCLPYSRGGGNRTAVIFSRWRGYARFPPCSEAAARGPHVTELMVDEVCVGESKSRGGAKAVRAARGQLLGSPNALLGYTSTAQYILGTFYNTWIKADALGYKRYRWSTVRHTSNAWYLPNGKPNWEYIDDVLSADRDPSHWVPNVWWVTQEIIDDQRPDMTKDEWIVEFLGGMSRGSGLVFSRDDLKAAICTGVKWTGDGSECEECLPYTDKCPMMKKEKLQLSMISLRTSGVDFGGIDPYALTVTGKRKKMIYILYSDERTGLSDEEALDWIDKRCKKYHVWDVFADPEQRAMRNALEAKGYSTPHVWAGGGTAVMKKQYVVNVKRFVEKHVYFIPKLFEYLVDSLAQLSYDSKGRIRKHNDHSFDSLMYACIDYDPDEDASAFYKEVKSREIAKIWE